MGEVQFCKFSCCPNLFVAHHSKNI